MNEQLIQLPSAAEVKRGMFAIHPDKAPGPDGFSDSFFQSNWDIVGPAITRDIQHFFTTGRLPSTINSTHIRLIPKIKSPKLVSEYRPISLCNVYYKVISKIISLRLNLVLQAIISENQSGFIPGRAISDNVLITHENFHYLKTSSAKKHCSMAVKTDMSKAYDRLEWNFIKEVLTRLGFHRNWITWVMECLSTVSYSFLLNYSVHVEVIPQRGIQQGDPLSPYIFILCNEVLSGLCTKAQLDGSLVGIKVATNCPRINHLLFADDTMLFIRSYERSCSTLMWILSLYEAASGQKINSDKSSITFSTRTSQGVKIRIKQILGIDKEGGVGKYLGLPEHFGRRKKDLFASIVDKIQQRALSWSSHQLSTAGKLVLLQYVLSAIPTFPMSCFELPVSICKKIQSVVTRFWWDSNDGKKKMCWVSWEKLTQPKSAGGLGLKDIQWFNKALLAKNSWRMLTNPDCLLARVLLGKYCQNDKLLRVEALNTSSHGWRGILAGRDLLVEHLGKVIGNGSSTTIWGELWISTDHAMLPSSPVKEDESDLYVSDLILIGTGKWNLARIKKILPALAEEIMTLRPSLTGANDSYIWYPVASGSYSAKSGYAAASAAALQVVTQPAALASVNWKKYVWNVGYSPKLKLLTWKILHEALPMGVNLERRGVVHNSTCIHCGATETTEHLFLHCPFAVQVWNLIPLKIPFNSIHCASFYSVLEASTSWVCLPPTGYSENIFYWVVWSLWTTRNHFLFESRHISQLEVAIKALGGAKEWSAAQLDSDASNNNTKVPTLPLLPSMPEETTTCNTNAAWNPISREAGLGWILSNQDTSTLQRSQFQTHVQSAITAEALAIWAALSHAIHLGVTKIWLRSDSLGLAKAIASITKPKNLHGVLLDIEALSLVFLFLLFFVHSKGVKWACRFYRKSHTL